MSYLNTLITLLFFASCGTAAPPSDPIPKHSTFKIQSQYVKEERVINVWTPLNYNESTDSFIVIYMPDGGVKEDFPHVANTLNDLVISKKIPPVILVGIENTQRRRDLSGPTEVESDKKIADVVGKSSDFRSFIQKELFAQIDSQYRTTNKKGILGESLAGLFVTETFMLHPEMFDFYIAFDPSIWWNDQYLLKNAQQILSKGISTKKTFWFAGSNAKDISKPVRRFAEALTAQNLPLLTFKYEDEKKEKHTTIFRATKEKAFIWTLNNL